MKLIDEINLGPRIPRRGQKYKKNHQKTYIISWNNMQIYKIEDCENKSDSASFLKILMIGACLSTVLMN